jgi:hypothetical protein
MHWWVVLCLGLVLCTVTAGYPDDRRWRGQQLPDRFTIDKPGKCEVICERRGREYKCREYRC